MSLAATRLAASEFDWRSARRWPLRGLAGISILDGSLPRGGFSETGFQRFSRFPKCLPAQPADFIPGELASANKKFGLEPVAAIGQPPAYYANRNRRGQRPPQWQAEIRDDTQDGESAPEDFPLHFIILAPYLLSTRCTYGEVFQSLTRNEIVATIAAHSGVEKEIPFETSHRSFGITGGSHRA